jgi:hypothetical protein
MNGGFLTIDGGRLMVRYLSAGQLLGVVLLMTLSRALASTMGSGCQRTRTTTERSGTMKQYILNTGMNEMGMVLDRLYVPVYSSPPRRIQYIRENRRCPD